MNASAIPDRAWVSPAPGTRFTHAISPEARQIGNALDWVTVDPDVFVASAIARIDLGVKRAIADMAANLTPKDIVEFGLAEGDFVSLSLAPDVPAAVAKQVAEVADAIRSGRIVIPQSYDGPEFVPEGIPCVIES